MRFIGIDLGASFLKVALLDTERMSIDRIRKDAAPLPLNSNVEGRKELDPKEIWTRVLKLLQETSWNRKIDGILVSNQMHGYILVDEEGAPITNYVTWQDGRGGEVHNREMVLNAFGIDGLTRTGMPLLTGLPSLNLCYQRHRESITEGLFLSLGDFVCHRLSGKALVHPSNCAGSGLMDLDRMDWNRQAMHSMDCDGFRFPAIAKDFQPMGKSAIFDDAAVFAAVGDQQAALLGALLDKGDLSLNIGTGSQVSMLTDRLEYGDFQTRPFFSGSYIKTITHIPAGRALNVLVAFAQNIVRSIVGNDISENQFWGAYDKVSYDQGDIEVDLSFFPGSATGDNGSIANIIEQELTMENVLAGAYRRMARNYLELSRRVGGESAERVILSGGLATKNLALRGAIQDSFQPVPLGQRYSEDTLVGLLIIAAAYDNGHHDHRDTYHIIRDKGVTIGSD